MNLVKNTPIPMRTDYRLRRPSDEIAALKNLKSKKQTTEQPERVYNLWFLSLKLLLEMEEKRMGFKKGKGKSTKEFIIGKDIIIDKKFYQEWDLDDVLTHTFYKWWKGHKELFETPSTAFSETPNSWKPKPHFRFIRVDTRNNYTSISREIERGLSDLKKGKTSLVHSKYPVKGETRYTNEIIKYNVMVRTLNEEDDREIFENEKRRFKSASGGSESPFNPSSSKLWRFYGEYMKLNPTEREYSKLTVLRSEDRWKLTDKGKYQRWARTEGFRIGRAFDSALRTEINRYISDFQKILNGVAKGMYRKPINF